MSRPRREQSVEHCVCVICVYTLRMPLPVILIESFSRYFHEKNASPRSPCWHQCTDDVIYPSTIFSLPASVCLYTCVYYVYMHVRVPMYTYTCLYYVYIYMYLYTCLYYVYIYVSLYTSVCIICINDVPLLCFSSTGPNAAYKEETPGSISQNHVRHLSLSKADYICTDRLLVCTNTFLTNKHL